LPELESTPNSLFEKLKADFLMVDRKEAKGNQRIPVEETHAKNLVVMVEELDQVASLRVPPRRCDFIAENPLMPGENPVFLVFLENDLFFHNFKVSTNAARCNEPSVARKAKVWYLFP
jgi:hypothetical protein